MATNDAPSTTLPAVLGEHTWRNRLADHIGLDDDQKLQVYRNVAGSASMRDATVAAGKLYRARRLDPYHSCTAGGEKRAQKI